jgi:hypothetical protein
MFHVSGGTDVTASATGGMEIHYSWLQHRFRHRTYKFGFGTYKNKM